MINKTLNAYVAVISTCREANVEPLTKIIGPATWYVNNTELLLYLKAGATEVYACGTNICQARNRAMEDAFKLGLPCIQVSDDLKKIELYDVDEAGKRVKQLLSFEDACQILLTKLKEKNYLLAGVAVSSNPLNYTGKDFSYDKLIVNDLIVCMPGLPFYDEDLALKEDYDMTVQQLTTTGGMVRADCLICDFPHRDNKGGANTYRTAESENIPTQKLFKKWGNLIIPHKTRPGQVSINYKALANYTPGETPLF